MAPPSSRSRAGRWRVDLSARSQRYVVRGWQCACKVQCSSGRNPQLQGWLLALCRHPTAFPTPGGREEKTPVLPVLVLFCVLFPYAEEIQTFINLNLKPFQTLICRFPPGTSLPGTAGHSLTDFFKESIEGMQGTQTWQCIFYTNVTFNVSVLSLGIQSIFCLIPQFLQVKLVVHVRPSAFFAFITSFYSCLQIVSLAPCSHIIKLSLCSCFAVCFSYPTDRLILWSNSKPVHLHRFVSSVLFPRIQGLM